VKNARFATDDSPLDGECSCWVCARHSRGYIRHLMQAGEPTASRLVSVHNISWTLQLMDRIRGAVEVGSLGSLRREILDVWG
jgi:queuine tRNA-ribosyltransferase